MITTKKTQNLAEQHLIQIKNHLENGKKHLENRQWEDCQTQLLFADTLIRLTKSRLSTLS
jgi:hypothetical protein